MNPLQHVVNQLNTVTTERNQLRTALVAWKRADDECSELVNAHNDLRDLIPSDDWGIE